MGYVEFTVNRDKDLLQKSLPLLLIDGKYTQTYEEIWVNNQKIENFDTIINESVENVKIIYGDNVTGLRFCNLDDDNINYSNRINSLVHIDADNFTDMSLMFNDCRYLTELDLNSVSTTNVTTMRSMFSGCVNIVNLAIDSWNVSNVEDMDCMFAGCINLTKLDINLWNTVSVNDTSWMFYKCSNLKELYMENFNTIRRDVDFEIRYNNMFDEINESILIKISTKFTIKDKFPQLSDNYMISISCLSIELEQDTYETFGSFEVYYSIVPENTNTGTLEIICTPNIKQISNYEFTLNPLKGVDGEIVFKHGSATSKVKVTYKRYIEYTVEKLPNYFLDENDTLPYIYYLNNTYDQNFIDVQVFLDDGTITNNRHTLLSDISKVRVFYKEDSILGIKFYNRDNPSKKPSKVKEITHIETTRFKDTSFMFYNAQYLTNIDLNKFVWSAITNTESMFENCINLKLINMDDWSSEKIVSYSNMFSNVNMDCKIYVGPDWKLHEKDTGFINKFIGLVIRCTDIVLSSNKIVLDEGKKSFKLTYKLIPIDTRDEIIIRTGPGITKGIYNIYTIDTSKTNTSYVEIQCGDICKKCDIEYTELPFIEYTVDNTIDSDRQYLNYGYDSNGNVISSTIPSLLTKYGTYNKDYYKIDITLNNGQTTDNLSTKLKDIKLVKLYYDDTDIVGIKFYDGIHPNYKSYLKEIRYINTKKFTNLDYLFYNCISMTEFNPSSINTSNATSMNYMFSNTSINELDLRSLYMNNIEYCKGMFMGSNKLSYLNIDYWETPKLQIMNNMFNGCESLIELNLSSLNTTNCVDMNMLLAGCKNLKRVIFGDNFKIENCATLTGLFYNCESLENIDTGVFNTSTIINMSDMFRGCKSLKTLDLSKFNTINLQKMPRMFQDCINLTTIDLSKFKTTKIIDMEDCFKGCTSLLYIDLTNFHINSIDENITNINGLFDGCTNINVIDFITFKSSLLTKYDRIFKGVPNICEIYTDIDWELTEEECGFTGQFNSRRISYEEDNFRYNYMIGYGIDGNKLGDEDNLPSLITVFSNEEHTFTLNSVTKGLISTNQRSINTIAHKAFKIDLSKANNDNTGLYIEIGLNCYSDIHDKFVISLSSDSNTPDIAFSNGLNTSIDGDNIIINGSEKRRMSYKYYKNKLYIYSNLITARGIYYLHFAYIKDNHIETINDYALIKYIKFKTDNSYFENNIIEKPEKIAYNYNTILDFSNESNSNLIYTDLQKININNELLINSSNLLPKWIRTGYNGKYPLLTIYKYNEYALSTTNFNLDNTSSTRYFRFNLTHLSKPIKLTIKYRISTQEKSDYFAIHLTRTENTPSINQFRDRLVKDSGLKYDNDYTTISRIINQPGIYYLHFNFVKDSMNRSGYDSVMIKSIQLEEMK